MKFISKTFSELSPDELYEILKSRAQIFMIEQNIICLDMDDLDRVCLHCFFFEDNRVNAYLRAFSQDTATVTIGRVLTLEHGKGIGRELMTKGIEEVKKHFGCKKICVHAQKQAVAFYAKMGFTIVSDEYLKEGIVHVTMEMEV